MPAARHRDLATGSGPWCPDLGTPDRVRTAADVLMGGEDPGKRVVVVGGGLVGCGAGPLAAQAGQHPGGHPGGGAARVLMVGTPVCDANTDMLKALLPFHGCKRGVGAPGGAHGAGRRGPSPV